MSWPLHTRALSVEAAAAAGGVAVRGTLLDMRKTGVVPVGGDLGTPGVVHQMAVEALIDLDARCLRTLRAQQPRVAFEASALTAGESCRDAAARLTMLEGAPLDDALARRLSDAQGGARGCSHLLTISQVLVAAVTWAIGIGALSAAHTARRRGERLFRRDIVVDGNRTADGDLELLAQLTDLAFAPAPVIAAPMQRFTALHEVRVRAPIALETLCLGSIAAAERRREADSLAAVGWTDRSARMAGLRGVTVFRGITAALMEQLGDAAADRPLLDAALMLAPTFIQVCGAMSEHWLARAAAADSLLGMGGLPDSCYMWRRGGALDRLRSSEDPVPTL
jgi:hypothetical protein